MRSSKLLAIIFFIILLGAGLAWAGSANGVRWQGSAVFGLCVALAFIIQWLAFIPAWFAQTERYYDLTGSLTYLSTIALALFLSGSDDFRSQLLAVLVVVWAVRLGSFLFLRISKDGKDGRFDHIKPHFLRFLMTWTLQGLWVAVTAGAALAAVSSSASVAADGFLWLGLGLWLLGFTFEVVADSQKQRFRTQADNSGEFIQSGLWSISRHPNYFGEILLWLGVSIIAYPVLSGWQYLTLISPVFVFFLLTRVSGIPLLEKRADKRWGDDTAYQAYKARTPVLIPFLGRKG